MVTTLVRLWRGITTGVAAAALASGFFAGHAAAASLPQQPTLLDQLTPPDAQCRRAIRRQEAASGIPTSLMTAISLVESGRWMPDGRYAAWPWSINVLGVGHVYQSKAEAIAGVRRLQAAGVRSIDVGCMQVNLMHHPEAFATLEEAFDPVRNAEYAAGFLIQLRAQTGSWQQATADYHSATPELGVPYARRVRVMMSQAGAPVPLEAPHLSAGLPLGGLTPASPLMTFGGVQTLPVFFARPPARAIRSLIAGPGRSLGASRSAAAPLYDRAQQARANWR